MRGRRRYQTCHFAIDRQTEDLVLTSEVMGADSSGGNSLVALLAALAVLAAMSSVLATVECPEACSCKWKGGKETVECVNASLVAIPNMGEDTQVIHLGGNRLADALR